MKVKTSITLDDYLLSRIDAVRDERESRSAFLERAAERLAEQRERAMREVRDTTILAEQAAGLNEEAEDNLALVASVFEAGGQEAP